MFQSIFGYINITSAVIFYDLLKNNSSMSSSRRSSATYFASNSVTPRNNLKTAEGPGSSGDRIHYDNILNEKHVRSSSKMR